SNSSETFNLQPTGETLLRAGSFQMPETLGWYSIAYQAYQNETEESPEDNHDTLHFAITDITYARDKGPVEGVILPQDDLSSLPYEIGNIYVATAGGTQAHSVSAAISIGTSVGAEVYARLYEFAVDTTIEANLIATSDPITVTSAMLNDANDLVLTHFIFDSPINLQNGYSYLATIACDEGADQMLVGSNGDANEFSSWVLFESDQWFYLTHVPIVRLNIGDITSVAEGENKPALQLFPNPADGYFVLSGAAIGSNFSVYDAQGKMMKQGVVKNTVTRIETSDLSPGMYVLRNETNSLHLHVIH
ncbi:MAG: T9SS type A sorting domain-containing protein, partial [Flavobacteriales bacterium]|nr:T9SS type A sorting domain-containing protein [Flavobacteriales bacterium]